MPRHRVQLLACCVLLVLVGGFGGASPAGLPRDLSVQVTITTTTYVRPRTVTGEQVFTLTCNPPGGTMPSAGRVCEMIARHPAAMLNPQQVGPRIVCLGGPPPDTFKTVSVSATADGSTVVFGQAGCGNPSGLAASVYLAAIDNEPSWLRALEERLVCDEDPELFADPTSVNVELCMKGLWTARSEQLIRVAAQVPRLAALRPLFRIASELRRAASGWGDTGARLPVSAACS